MDEAAPRISLEEALKLSRSMQAPTIRTDKIPTTKQIDRYILLERRLERTKSGSAEERRTLYQLNKLEAVNGVTSDDAERRKEELRIELD